MGRLLAVQQKTLPDVARALRDTHSLASKWVGRCMGRVAGSPLLPGVGAGSPVQATFGSFTDPCKWVASDVWPRLEICGSKAGTKIVTFVNGSKDQPLRNPRSLISTHTHFGREMAGWHFTKDVARGGNGTHGMGNPPFSWSEDDTLFD